MISLPLRRSSSKTCVPCRSRAADLFPTIIFVSATGDASKTKTGGHQASKSKATSSQKTTTATAKRPTARLARSTSGSTPHRTVALTTSPTNDAPSEVAVTMFERLSQHHFLRRMGRQVMVIDGRDVGLDVADARHGRLLFGKGPFHLAAPQTIRDQVRIATACQSIRLQVVSQTVMAETGDRSQNSARANSPA